MPAPDWPGWLPPARLDALEAGGYQHVARYVVPAVLAEHFGHVFPTAAPAPGTPVLETVHELWEALVAQEVRYSHPLYNPGALQRIRDPGWLLRKPSGDGTCIELATLLAGACLNRGLQVWLVMLRDADSGHVGVAVRLAGAAHALPFGLEPTGEVGVLELLPGGEADLADDPSVLLLDPTSAAAGSPPRGLEDGRRALSELVRGGRYRVHLVDVAARHELPSDRPLTWSGGVPGALTLALPALPAEWRLFGSRLGLQNTIAAARGTTMVLHGAPGLGKSLLALAAARSGGGGFGWFLSGESSAALEASLAAHEAGERGLAPEVIADAVTRRDLAQEARRRLEAENAGWVVVVDNVDHAPEALLRGLVVPGAAQCLVVTSTLPADDWSEVAASRPLEPYALGRLDPVEATKLLSGADEVAATLAERAEGNPLVLAALARLLAHAPEAAAALSKGLAQAERELTLAEVADAHVATVIEHGLVDLPACALVALLPADHVPARLLGDGVAEQLVAAGVLLPGSGDVFTCHRLYQRALSAVLAPHGDLLRAAAEQLAADPGVCRLLVEHGDVATTSRLGQALEHSVDPFARCGLGQVQEMFDRAASIESFRRAEPMLDPRQPAHRPALAAVLHAKAREINQGRGFADLSPRELRGARQHGVRMARVARTYRAPGDVVGRAQSQAIEALLRRELSDAVVDPQRRLGALRRVLAELRESYLVRLDELGQRDPSVDRAHFNLAGTFIQLAKADPVGRWTHLEDARAVYAQTLAYRIGFYKDPNELIAASTYGLALYEYYAALFEVELGGAVDPAGRLALGARHAAESLDMRRRAKQGRDAERKSADILAKIGALQYHLSGGDLTTWNRTLRRELRDLGGAVLR